MKKLYTRLFKEKLIDENQFQLLDAVGNYRILSVYYELRTFLYIGIMLFTGGVGYIVYQNIGDIGHIAVMSLMGVSIVLGVYYVNSKSKAYTNLRVIVDHIYYDYILVLISLITISLFTYFQVYFELVELLINWTSYLSGSLFLFMAYRYDNKMVLSMGITAFAAAYGLSLSPLNWVSGNWFSSMDFFSLSISFGVILLVIGQALSYKNIKRHFTFTYLNFGLLLIYYGALGLLFESEREFIIVILLLLFSGFVSWYCWKGKLFLFFLYGILTCYIALTYLFFALGMDDPLAFYYFPVTCIGGVIFLVKKRDHFSND